MSKVVRFVTLGCKVNQYETNAMAQKFLEKGYKIIEEIEKRNVRQRLLPDISVKNIKKMEIGGLEPLTYALRTRRSPS